MEMHEYQERAQRTAVYPKAKGLEYCTLGLVGEAGEFANKVKKLVREDENGPSFESLASELGDVLWYLSQIATELNMSLENIAWDNLEKLSERMERGKLKGEGDNR